MSDTITFGAKFDMSTTYIGEDGKEYYRIIPNSGITITFGADASKYIKKEKDRNSKEYKRFVCEVLKRDNEQCVCCGSRVNPEVHHIKPYAKYKELRTDTNNGITLCEQHQQLMLNVKF